MLILNLTKDAAKHLYPDYEHENIVRMTSVETDKND